MRMGVVADDLTGSTDIGIMFTKAGYSTEIFTFQAKDEVLAAQVRSSTADVVILNINARLFPEKEAYEIAQQATLALRQAGCKQYYNKTCSVFRGPVGAYFDGMLDALDAKFALVALGFPKNGRVTIGGLHYVHGKLLEESEFRNDPIHPMRQSNLVAILQSQTRRMVAALMDIRSLTPAEIRRQIEDAKATCSYLILDVPDQAALVKIAQAAGDAFIFCGSSALAEELSTRWGEPAGAPEPLHVPANPTKAVLIASGSLMPQSRDQLAWLKRMGTRAFEFPAGAVVDRAVREAAIEAVSAEAARVITSEVDVIVHMPNEPETVAEMQAQAKQMGLSAAELGSLVSTTLAEVIARVVERSGVTRLAVAGGETSAAVCARLGIRRFRVWEEIEPGLPSCLALDGQSMFLVLKSGSFGSSDFLAKALRYLHQA